MKKKKIQDIKNDFEAVGWTVLENEYLHSKHPMECICPNGHRTAKTWASFQSGYGCIHCCKTQKLTNKKIESFFKENGCVLLDEYINSKSKMRYLCKCGNKSKISWSNFKNGNRCKRCGISKRSASKKLDYDYVNEKFNENQCELLENSYCNATTKMRYRCSCGFISKISWAKFQQGQRCNNCKINKIREKLRLKYSFVVESFASEKCELLEETYFNSATFMKFKCSCGAVDKITWDKFKSGERCSNCMKNRKAPRFSDALRKWREEIYERDLYKCQICNSGGKINAHHLNSFDCFPNQRTSIENGIALCKTCHLLFHKEYGNGKNTAEQFEEWRNNIE